MNKDRSGLFIVGIVGVVAIIGMFIMILNSATIGDSVEKLTDAQATARTSNNNVGLVIGSVSGATCNNSFQLALTPQSYPGTAVTSLAVGNSICKQTFGNDWKWAEFHDDPVRGQWSITGDLMSGSFNTRAWMNIGDQNAECFSTGNVRGLTFGVPRSPDGCAYANCHYNDSLAPDCNPYSGDTVCTASLPLLCDRQAPVIVPLSVDLKINGADNPSAVAYKSRITATWTTTGDLSYCYGYGHWVPLYNLQGMWSTESTKPTSGSVDLMAAFAYNGSVNNIQYMSQLQISVGCIDKQGNQVSDTVIVPVSAPTPTCTDSDGGLNSIVKGYTTDSTGVKRWDTCDAEGTSVIEQFCDSNGNVQFSYLGCSNYCADGACNNDCPELNNPEPKITFSNMKYYSSTERAKDYMEVTITNKGTTALNVSKYNLYLKGNGEGTRNMPSNVWLTAGQSATLRFDGTYTAPIFADAHCTGATPVYVGLTPRCAATIANFTKTIIPLTCIPQNNAEPDMINISMMTNNVTTVKFNNTYYAIRIVSFTTLSGYDAVTISVNGVSSTLIEGDYKSVSGLGVYMSQVSTWDNGHDGYIDLQVTSKACSVLNNNCGYTPRCGNGKVDLTAGEECDGSVLPTTYSCYSLGYNSGYFTCTSTCKIDKSLCINTTYKETCGNDNVAPSEVCDNDNFGFKYRSGWISLSTASTSAKTATVTSNGQSYTMTIIGFNTVGNKVTMSVNGVTDSLGVGNTKTIGGLNIYVGNISAWNNGIDGFVNLEARTGPIYDCTNMGYDEGELTCNSCRYVNTSQCIKYTCTDSDGGANWYVKGTCSSNYPSIQGKSVFRNYTDSCGNYNAINEYVCDDDHACRQDPYTPDNGCPNGCVNGACVHDNGASVKIKSIKINSIAGYVSFTDIQTSVMYKTTEGKFTSVGDSVQLTVNGITHTIALIDTTSGVEKISVDGRGPYGQDDILRLSDTANTGLNSYPTFLFDSAGNFKGQIVVGRLAPQEDTQFALDIAASLLRSSTSLNPNATTVAVLDNEASYTKPSVIIDISCSNTFAAWYLGNPADCSTGYVEGTGRLDFMTKNGQSVIIVGGYNSADRRSAAYVMTHWSDYKSNVVAGKSLCIKNNGGTNNYQVYACEPLPTSTQTCTDSDGRIDYYVKGSITGAPGYGRPSTDVCGEVSGKLLEMFCINSTDYDIMEYTCPNGCSNGACIVANQSSFCKQESSTETICSLALTNVPLSAIGKSFLIDSMTADTVSLNIDGTIFNNLRVGDDQNIGIYVLHIEDIDYGSSSGDGVKFSLSLRAPNVRLDSYPQPFISSDMLPNAVFIVGRNAAVDDVIGITDMLTSLQRYASDNPFPTGIVKFDDQVSDDQVYNRNVVIVGGMCANTVTANIYGNPEDCTTQDTPGIGHIKILANRNTDKVVLLVHGYNAEDTTMATRVLANWKDYAGVLDGATSVCVSGTMNSIQAYKC